MKDDYPPFKPDTSTPEETFIRLRQVSYLALIIRDLREKHVISHRYVSLHLFRKDLDTAMRLDGKYSRVCDPDIIVR